MAAEIITGEHTINYEADAQIAIRRADALLAELNKEQAKPVPPTKPVPVIWPYRCRHDTLESVRTAWESGLITAVAIFGGNRITSSQLYTTESKRVTEWCRHEGVPMILVRGLFPTRGDVATDVGTLADPEFYKSEIKILRREAGNVGAAWCGYDAEPYGDTPVRNYIKGGHYPARTQAGIIAAIEAATSAVGQVDYVLPAGGRGLDHPYCALAGLGETVITESTYYHDSPDVTYPWDIRGMFVDILDDGHRYTVAEVFGSHKYLWKDTGVFLWQEKALPVAQELKGLGQ